MGHAHLLPMQVATDSGFIDCTYIVASKSLFARIIADSLNSKMF